MSNIVGTITQDYHFDNAMKHACIRGAFKWRMRDQTVLTLLIAAAAGGRRQNSCRPRPLRGAGCQGRGAPGLARG